MIHRVPEVTHNKWSLREPLLLTQCGSAVLAIACLKIIEPITHFLVIGFLLSVFCSHKDALMNTNFVGCLVSLLHELLSSYLTRGLFFDKMIHQNK